LIAIIKKHQKGASIQSVWKFKLILIFNTKTVDYLEIFYVFNRAKPIVSNHKKPDFSRSSSLEFTLRLMLTFSKSTTCGQDGLAADAD
jgi:hypothetical protein